MCARPFGSFWLVRGKDTAEAEDYYSKSFATVENADQHDADDQGWINILPATDSKDDRDFSVESRQQQGQKKAFHAQLPVHGVNRPKKPDEMSSYTRKSASMGPF
jgi:hypothetical protein